GKLMAVVPKGEEERLLAAMRKHPLGRDAAIIGSIVANHIGMVVLQSRIGGQRVVTMLAGEQLPRNWWRQRNSPDLGNRTPGPWSNRSTESSNRKLQSWHDLGVKSSRRTARLGKSCPSIRLRCVPAGARFAWDSNTGSTQKNRSTPMPETNAPYGRKTQRPPAVQEIHVVWITAGLGCDGDSVSIT